MIGARDRESERVAEAGLCLGGAHARNQRGIARRVSRVAIVRQMRDAPLDERVERRLLLGLLVEADERLDAGRIMRRAPAPFEGLLVGLDRDAVELDRAIDRLRAGSERGPSARPRRA